MKKQLTSLQKSVLECVNRGMSTKEIAKQLECSESSVKQIRANKKLNAVHELSTYDAIRQIIPKAIMEMEKIINSPDAGLDAKIAASKQIIELSKISESILPKDDIEIKVIYE